MTAPRPADWTPLAVDDPVPGDPERIGDQARQLNDMAAGMRTQIDRLHAIGRDGAQVGQAFEALRGAATEVSGRLEQAVGRYERVAGELRLWGEELARAQETSLRIRERAQAAAAERPPEVQAAPMGPPPTPEETEQARQRDVARDEADRALYGERKLLYALCRELREMAAERAGRIDQAIDDDVVDSFGDDFADFYDANIDWIEPVTDALSWVATGLAIAAIFVAAPWVFVLALGIGALVTASQAGAAATGHGNWADVAIGVVGLFTLGFGRVAGKAVTAGRAATRAASARAAGKAARKEALAASSAQRTVYGRVLNRPGASNEARAFARRRIDQLKSEARGAETAAFRAERDWSVAATTRREMAKRGDAGAARELADVRATGSRTFGPEGQSRRFDTDPRVARAAADTERQADVARRYAYGGLGVDSVDKSMDPPLLEPTVPAYDDLKERSSYRLVGSGW